MCVGALRSSVSSIQSHCNLPLILIGQFELAIGIVSIHADWIRHNRIRFNRVKNDSGFKWSTWPEVQDGAGRFPVLCVSGIVFIAISTLTSSLKRCPVPQSNMGIHDNICAGE